MSERTFKVVMSERCYRLKVDALDAHAPRHPGVYELVTFDAERKPVVLFVGLAEKSIYEAIEGHLAGLVRPTHKELHALHANVYFDYAASSDAESFDDLKDIAGALVARHKPRFNTGPELSSGRYSSVTVEEVG